MRLYSMFKFGLVVTCSCFLFSCWHYKIARDVYPTHFLHDSDHSNQYLPKDIIEALPGDFRLANELGYMTTFIYSDASLGYKQAKNDRYKRIKWLPSKLLKNKLQEIKDNGYNVFTPVQFPYVICFYPSNINLIEQFENEASIDLLITLNQIHNNDSGLSLLDMSIEKAIISLNDSQKVSQSCDELIITKNNEEQSWVKKNVEIDQKIKEVDDKIAHENATLKLLSAESPAAFETALPSLYDNVNFDLPVTTKHDPFEDVHQRTQVDISRKPYNTPSTSRNGYPTLDGKMVEGMDKFNDAMTNPREKLKDKGFSESELSTLEGWSKDPNNRLEVTSASRSPQHQMAIGNNRKAGTLSTKHLLGVAVDIKLKGKSYDPSKNRPAYDLMRKVAFNSGINFTLPGDAVEVMHGVLTDFQDGSSPNTALYCSKLADLLFDYNMALGLELASQAKEGNDKNESLNAKNSALSKLRSEIQSKLSTVNDINKRISGLQASYSGKTDNLQKKANELCSILAAKSKKEAAEKQKNYEREHQTPDRHQREVEKPEHHQREIERPEHHQREMPHETPHEAPHEHPREHQREQRGAPREFGPQREIRPT